MNNIIYKFGIIQQEKLESRNVFCEEIISTCVLIEYFNNQIKHFVCLSTGSLGIGSFLDVTASRGENSHRNRHWFWWWCDTCYTSGMLWRKIQII